MNKFIRLISNIFLLECLIIHIYARGTDAVIVGDVQCLESEGCHIPYATIIIVGTSIGTASDATGHFMLTNLLVGKHLVKASAVGYKSSTVDLNYMPMKLLKLSLNWKRIW